MRPAFYVLSFLLQDTFDPVKGFLQGLYTAGAGQTDVTLAAGAEGVAGQRQDMGLPEDQVRGLLTGKAGTLDVHEQVESALGGIDHAELGNLVDPFRCVEHALSVLFYHLRLDFLSVAEGIDTGPLRNGGSGKDHVFVDLLNGILYRREHSPVASRYRHNAVVCISH